MQLQLLNSLALFLSVSFSKKTLFFLPFWFPFCPTLYHLPVGVSYKRPSFSETLQSHDQPLGGRGMQVETRETLLRTRLLAGHCISHPAPQAGPPITSSPCFRSPVRGISVKNCVCYAVTAGEGGMEKQMTNSSLPPLLTEATQGTGKTAESWDETWVFNPSLGVSLLQDLAQITSPFCITLRFFTCEMGKKAAS